MRSLKSNVGITRGRGISASVLRLTWLGSNHRRAAIHDSMSSLTQFNRLTSVALIEMNTSRNNRDISDLMIFENWLKSYNLFEHSIKEFKSLSNGFIAIDVDGINYDEAEEVGAKFHKH